MKLLVLLAAVCLIDWTQSAEDAPIDNTLMENPNLWQGDIVLDPDEIESDMRTDKLGYASIKGGRWPRTIPYKIERSIGRKGRQAIQAAIADYHAYTCLRFVLKPRASRREAHISFYRGSGCSSPVGYRRGRMNRISLAQGCWHKGTVMHEMGHTIGLYHEQSRPDRDSYVRIIRGNIQPAMRFNFNKQKASNINSLGTRYDYYSMMHYPANAFGRGRITIQTIDRRFQNVIGNRNGFSDIDKEQIHKMYCENGGTTGTTGGRTGGRTGGNCKDNTPKCRAWKAYCRSSSSVKRACRKTCRTC